MQVKINLPDNLTPEKTSQLIKNVEKLRQKEGVALEIENNLESDIDAQDELNFENIAVDTGIEDFAVKHDRYLYKTSNE